MDSASTSLLVVTAALLLAIVLERIIEIYVKPFVPADYHRFIPLGASVVGLLFAFGFNVDLITSALARLSVTPAWTPLGKVVTGFLIGGGSNLIHELFPGKE